MKYIASQIALFSVVAILFSPTDWNFTLAYGSLLITPIWLLWHQKPYFSIAIGCAIAYMLTVLVTIFDKDFIGHMPPLYFALGCYCYYCFNRKTLAMWLSFAIAIYGLFMMGIYGPRGEVNYWLQVSWNLIFATQLLYLGSRYGVENEPKTPAVEISQDYKKVA